MIKRNVDFILILIALLVISCSCNKGNEITASGSSSAANSAFSSDDLKIVIDNKELRCNADFSTVLPTLGNDYQYSESKSCEYDGLDKIYIFKHFSIYTFPQNQKDYISEITLNDNSYSTSKGLKVGTKKDEVITAYGENFFTSGVNLTYNIENNAEDTKAASLYFTVDENDTVTAIGMTADKN